MRLVFALAAMILGAGAVTYWVWRSSPDVAPCQDVVLTSVASPDAANVADLFEQRCDASVTTHVALRRASDKARKDVFVAHGSVPVRVRWNGTGQVLIESPAPRVIIQETSWRSISVGTHHKSPTDGGPTNVGN